MASARGAFILFEGVDRCGKTTQAQRLVATLCASNQPAVFMRFPDRDTAIGGQIDAYLKGAAEVDDRAIHLLFSANRWEKRCVRFRRAPFSRALRPNPPSFSSRARPSAALLRTLRAGTHVVMDRYAFSGVAFSSAKPGLDVDWCAAPDEGLPAPDVVLFMDLPTEAAAARGGFGGERYENAAFQVAVRAAFSRLQERVGGALLWRNVDASGSRDDVAARVEAAALPVVETAKGGALELRALWACRPLEG
jgi:dTMP kinase